MEMVWISPAKIRTLMKERNLKTADLEVAGVMDRSTYYRCLKRGTLSRPKADKLTEYLGAHSKDLEVDGTLRELFAPLANDIAVVSEKLFGKEDRMEEETDYDVFEARVEALAGKWDGIAPDIAVDELQGLAELVGDVESGRKVKHPRKKMVNAIADAMIAAEILRIHYGISRKRLGKTMTKRAAKG